MEGTVVDEAGVPLVGVMIERRGETPGADNADVGFVSEEHGRWRISATEGTYSVTFHHPGHETAEREIVIEAGDVTRVEIVLEAKPGE
jgi:hypothetical protein